MVMSRGRSASAPPACFPAPSPKAVAVSAQVPAKGARACPQGGPAAAQAVPDTVGPVRAVGLAL